MPLAISPNVFTEHGTTTMPRVRNDPLATAAPMSSIGYQVWASSFRLRTPSGSSCTSVRSAARLTTRWVSIGVERSTSSKRNP